MHIKQSQQISNAKGRLNCVNMKKKKKKKSFAVFFFIFILLSEQCRKDCRIAGFFDSRKKFIFACLSPKATRSKPNASKSQTNKNKVKWKCQTNILHVTPIDSSIYFSFISLFFSSFIEFYDWHGASVRFVVQIIVTQRKRDF